MSMLLFEAQNALRRLRHLCDSTARSGKLVRRLEAYRNAMIVEGQLEAARARGDQTCAEIRQLINEIRSLISHQPAARRKSVAVTGRSRPAVETPKGVMAPTGAPVSGRTKSDRARPDHRNPRAHDSSIPKRNRKAARLMGK